MGRGDIVSGPTTSRRGSWVRVFSLARVCDVAAKHGSIAQYLSGWRRLARKGELFVPINAAPAFVPLLIEPLAPAQPLRHRQIWPRSGFRSAAPFCM